MPKFTTADYAQMLVNGVDNFTATYFADVVGGNISHDSITRAIEGKKLSPRVLREKALELIAPSVNGYLAIDDTVLDKDHAEKIEVASAQYSGQKHGITTGIGVVTMVYINPETGKFWALDYRVYDKPSDGKKKTDLALEMLDYYQTMSELYPDRLPFTTVLMDAGYTCKKIMQYVVRKGKIFYGVMPRTRKVSYLDQDGLVTSKHIDAFNWDNPQLKDYGITVCIEDLPKNKPLRIFQIMAKRRVEYIVTNDVSIQTTKAAKHVGGFRWKIEQLHRETKQLTGLAKCQARKGRKQRNHICIAFVVWHQLNELARQMRTTLYEVKHRPLREYQKELWRNPAYRVDAGLLGGFA